MDRPAIETERLILRKFDRADIKAIYDIYSDVEMNRFLPWFPLKSIKEAEILFEEKYLCSMGYDYALCLKRDNFPIGYISVDMGEAHDLGYGLKKEFWNKGLITEGVRAVAEQLKRDDIKYITATHDINNPASGRVMEKLGMRYKYSYMEQWQPKDILVTFRMYQLNLDGNEERVFEKYMYKSKMYFIENIGNEREDIK